MLRLERTSPGTSVYNGSGGLRGIGVQFPSLVGPLATASQDRLFNAAVQLADAVGIPRPVRPVQTSSRGGFFSRVGRNIRRVGQDVADGVTGFPSAAVEQVQEIAEDVLEQAQEFAEEAVQFGVEFVGAEGLSIREIADAVDLRGTIDFILSGVQPWQLKVTVYANQLEEFQLAELRALPRSEAGTLLDTLGLELASPPPLPGAPGFVQSAPGQLITLGVSFIPGIGTLISAITNVVGSIGSAFGQRETAERQEELETALNTINTELQVQLDRSVQMLGFLGDPDALDVLGLTPELEPTIEGETAPVRFSTVLPIAAAAAGVGLLAITALSGPRTRPGVLGRAEVGLGALDPSVSLGLPELSDLIAATNRLTDENDRLAALLLEVSTAPVELPEPEMPEQMSGIGVLSPRAFVVPVILGISALLAFAGARASQSD